MNKKDSPWFSHDADASDDPKCIALIESSYGWAGYGRWWKIVEVLRKQDGYKYSIASKFSWPSLGKAIGMSSEEAEQFITSLIEDFELLQNDGHYLWSDSLIERMSTWDAKRKHLSDIGRKGAEARERNRHQAARQQPGQSDESNQDKETPKRFKPPTLEEVKAYFSEKGYNAESAERAYNYYTENNWRDSKGDKVKNWKSKMIANWFKPEYKIVSASGTEGLSEMGSLLKSRLNKSANGG